MPTSNRPKPPAVRCGRNHRHASREQADECEDLFAARAELKRQAEAKKLPGGPDLTVKKAAR